MRNALAFFVVAMTYGQTAGEHQGAISGTVVNRRTGERIASATLTLMPVTGATANNMLRAQSDAEGRFQFTGVPANQYWLGATARGYLRGEYGARKPGMRGTAVTPKSGSGATPLKLELTQHSVITGRVLTDTGEPIERGMVEALRGNPRRGELYYAYASSVQVNDRGEFRLSGLAPGRVVLMTQTAAVSPPITNPGEPRKGYVQTFYPNVIDPAQAAFIDVPEGVEIGPFDIRVEPVEVVNVRGKVLTAAGLPPDKTVRVTMSRRNWPAARGSFDAKPREFEFRDIAPGSYVISILKGLQVLLEELVEVGKKDLEGLEFRVPATADLDGRLRLPKGDSSDPAEFELLLINLSGMRQIIPVTKPSAEGAFTISDIGPGRFNFSFRKAPTGAYVATVEAGGKTAGGSEFELRSAAGTITVTLGLDGGTVSGTVRHDEKPFAGATVLLAPERAHQNDWPAYRTVSSGPDGSYSISSVPPGTYRICAFEDIQPQQWEAPKFLETVESKFVEVKVPPHGRSSVALAVIPSR